MSRFFNRQANEIWSKFTGLFGEYESQLASNLDNYEPGFEKNVLNGLPDMMSDLNILHEDLVQLVREAKLILIRENQENEDE